jgi:hypothetical protein
MQVENSCQAVSALLARELQSHPPVYPPLRCPVRCSSIVHSYTRREQPVAFVCYSESAGDDSNLSWQV